MYLTLGLARLSQIRPEGMVPIMDMPKPKDTRHMDMHPLLRILTHIMGHILAMQITNSHNR